ncbi:MAG TPA: aspartate/glutamate racemase family protein [Albitalea sp.]|uniref:aspartate/glutamate racemase family protein n=1 Tax=Piscinibacter sp. TaxID=1903157 RepID=UPI002ED23FF1
MAARIGLIHALAHSVAPINEALARDWPEAQRMNLLDDSLSADLAAAGALDAPMHARFSRLARYAIDAGCDALLFTCSAFGPCIDAVKREHPDRPVLKPNEAMIDEATASGLRVGLVASFAPTLRSMPAEFPVAVEGEWAEGALAALDAGHPELHDERIAEAALRLKARGAQLIALAQFSMARAAGRVRERSGLPVLTTVDSAVRALRKRLPGA